MYDDLNKPGGDETARRSPLVGRQQHDRRSSGYEPVGPTTVCDTLEWQKARPAENQTLRSGLTPELDAELLKLLKG